MQRRTKIVATLGPATDDILILTDMMRVGLDVARVNFSHGQQDDHARRIELVREAAARAGKIVGILADLGGPKIRIEGFREGRVRLREGERFALDPRLDLADRPLGPPLRGAKPPGEPFEPGDPEKGSRESRGGRSLLAERDRLVEVKPGAARLAESFKGAS